MATISSTYAKGLDRDTSISKLTNESIYDALNIDLVTDLGTSTGSIHNHRGNKLDFSLPDRVLSVYKLIIKNLPTSGTITGNISILGSAYPPVVVTISSSTTILDLYNQITSQLPSNVFIVNKNNSNMVFVNIEDSYQLQINPADPLFPYLGISLKAATVDNPVIIGWTMMIEGIVLFTTQKQVLESGNLVINDSKTPNGTTGQIWYIEYDDVEDKVIGTNNGVLVQQTHLKYHGVLNFSLANAIYREAVARYEDVDKANVYWTDNFNPPRVFNIFNPEGFAIEEELLDWKPSIKFSVPIIKKVLNSGSIKVGSYQFAYRMKTNDGGMTQFSPLSKLINITSKKELTTFIDYDGAEPGTDANKSIKLQVSALDLNFDTIEFAVIEYQVKNSPLVYVFKELPITSKKVEVIYTGNEQKVPITIAELVNPRIFFDRVKTFTQKKNRLYPANTKKQTFEIKNWDARSYRFNNAGICKLYTVNGVFQEFNSSVPAQLTALYNLPDVHDAVNPYNDDSGTVYGLLGTVFDFTRDQWWNDFQYKFQTDGVTYGGEGPNVDYKIITKEYLGDTDIYTGKSGVPFNTVLFATPSTENLGVVGQDYDIEGLDGSKNIYIQEIYRSHQIGEVYRYGIVLYNQKGEESFVSWIADIRIPEPREDSQFDLSRVDGINLKLRTYLIEFTIKNVSALIANNPGITGFKIVRKERDILNRNRHGMGVLMAPMGGKVMINGDTYGTGSGPAGANPGTDVYLLTRIQSLIGVGLNDVIQDKLNLPSGSTPAEDAFLQANCPNIFGNMDGLNDPPDYPRIVLPRYNFDFDKRLTSFEYSGRLPILKSPEVDFEKYGNNATHYNIVSRFDWGESAYWTRMCIDDVAVDEVVNHIRNSKAFYVFLSNPVDYGKSLYSNNVIDINSQKTIDVESTVVKTFSSFMNFDYHHIGTYRRAFYDNPSGASSSQHRWNSLAGLGTKMLFTEVQGTKLESDINGDYKDGGLEEFTRTRINLVNLCTHNFGQYGGPWRSSRYNDVYSISSEFVPIDVAVNPQPLITSGDVYTTYYTCTATFMHWRQAGETKEDFSKNVFPQRQGTGLGAIYNPIRHIMSALALGFPCQTSVNVDLRYGKYWNKNQVITSSGLNGIDFASFLFDEYTANDAYTQENNTKTFTTKPFNVNFNEEQPFTVWASELKLEGEAVDSWRTYLINNQKDVEGIYGPINKIVTFKEDIISYQNKALCKVLSEEVSSVNDNSGSVFQIGLGAVLVGYQYLTKETGTIHQHSVIPTADAIFHFDARLKKMFSLGNGVIPISDAKGLNSFFKESLSSQVLVDDMPLLSRGIHGEFDSKYNKVYYTFADSIKITLAPGQLFPLLPLLPNQTITFTGCVIPNAKYLQLLKEYTVNGVIFQLSSLIPTGNTYTIELVYKSGPWQNLNRGRSVFYLENKYTIAFNRFLEAYESFYSFTPTLYLNTGKRLLSGNPYDLNTSAYTHNRGDYGKFYNLPIKSSKVEFYVTADGTSKSTFKTNYCEFWSQVFDQNGQDVFNETINSVVFSNDYQSTLNSLAPLNAVSLKRFERMWGINTIRDYTTSLPYKPYLRDKYLKVAIEYYNTNNNRFILHNWNTDLIISYPVSK